MVMDTNSWVASLKADVQSMLEAFRRQHAEGAGGAVERISKSVADLRLGVNELLPKLREARLKIHESDSSARRDYLDGISQWVDEVRTAADELCATYAGERSAAADEAREARDALLAELARWGDALRSQVGDLSTQMRDSRAQAAQAAAAARRDFVQGLRDEVSAMRSSFRLARTAGTRTASNANSAGIAAKQSSSTVRAQDSQPRQSEPATRAWSGKGQPSSSRLNEINRALRERSRTANS
jgi:hypothetical protein